MKKTVISLSLAVMLAFAAGPKSASAAGVAPAASLATQSQADQGYVQEIKKKKRRFKRRRLKRRRHLYYRPWRRRRHYGNIYAGIVLGTIIGVAIANAAPPRPSPNLCWYWTNRAHTRGYWDYCY